MLAEAAYVQRMARYNRWQNRSLVAAADTLPPAALTEDRGAFFGSILATLSHLLWADRIWLSRFGAGDPPAEPLAESPRHAAHWDSFRTERAALDETIIAWTDRLTADDLTGDLAWYSGSLGRDVTTPRGLCLVHFFNHQTHHRGQVHALLTAAGARPDATDLVFMPDTAL